MLSAKEVYGKVTWWTREGGDRPFYDGVYNAEGVQYRLYRNEGINDDTDTSSVLRLSGTNGAWWLRTPNPYENLDESKANIFFGVSIYVDITGKMRAAGDCNKAMGVAPCFCI